MRKIKINKEKLKEEIIGWIFIAPVLLGILFFTLVPMLQSFYYSWFSDFTMLRPPSGFGLTNLKRMFTLDQSFWPSLKNTFVYTVVMVPITTVLSFALAMLLNVKRKGIGVFRTIYYLPVLIPAVAMGLIWRDIYHPTFGFGNAILRALGLPESMFIYDKHTAMISFMFTSIFSLGGAMITWLAALKNVPDTLYESAVLEGAGFFVKTIKITVPLCTPMIFYNMLLSIIGSLQMFGPAYIIGGGPENSLLFYAVNIYNTAFSGSLRMGYACALAWILFAIILAISLLYFKLSGKWVYYSEDMA